MTIESRTKQHIQDCEYSFPYHYVAQFRDGFKHYFLDTWSINYASTIEFLLEEIGPRDHARIVDVGCGDGRFSRELARASGDSTVVGIDYSRRAIGLAAAMNPDVTNLEFHCHDIMKDPMPESFDVAVLMEVLEHIPVDETRHFIAGVHALLRKGGELYLTVPHVNKPVEYKHFQHFTTNTISSCLDDHFRVLECVPFERQSWVRTVISTLLSNRLFILRNPHLLGALYRLYRRYLFFCDDETSCQRLFVKAVAN